MHSLRIPRAGGHGLRWAGLVVAASIVLARPALAEQGAMPSPEEMWRIIQMQSQQLQEQSQQIDSLKNTVQQLVNQQGATEQKVTQTEQRVIQTEQRVSETEQRVVATAEAVEQVQSGESSGGGGGWWDRTSIGGYGELHYEGGTKDELDFHRFVLFVGHEFNDRIRMFAELELEHALVEDTDDGSGPGEFELEQAYLQFDLNRNHRINAGLQLIPVGILNETHEPPTFFGVERNQVEANIIPTTWWEGGIGVSGNFGASGISYDFMVHSGLDVSTTGGSAFTVRGGRQKVAKAIAKEPAFTGRLRYTGITGVELAATAQYQTDITQGTGDPLTGEKVSAWLFSGHVDARYEGFGLRALYARWWLDGEAPRALGRDKQYGFYIEPSYRFPVAVGNFLGGDAELGFFYRYSKWDNTAGMDTILSAIERHTIGANFWPHPDVVFKLDYFWENRANGFKDDRFDLGVGFQF